MREKERKRGKGEEEREADTGRKEGEIMGLKWVLENTSMDSNERGERGQERDRSEGDTHTERQRDVPFVLVLHLLLPEIEIPHQPANPEQEQGNTNEGAVKVPRNGDGDEGNERVYI